MAFSKAIATGERGLSASTLAIKICPVPPPEAIASFQCNLHNLDTRIPVKYKVFKIMPCSLRQPSYAGLKAVSPKFISGRDLGLSNLSNLG
ncbi:hypothetical protein NIES592_06280 [Fischerella major NIES-592]|uniref:Uncharacterized protein n=2 Tax=Fischerella TaxID=1190 RepID=A0A1U7H3I8_9CYAN|nr:MULTISPECIES: hypothetical protein [Fischerella]OKH15683.1 hypothetical protein NIES592_06280 [Fischerella major NIES-592]PMB39699.1 hypothetical protein CEN41_21100 [Fischerella thermalis CCMEE 5330]